MKTPIVSLIEPLVFKAASLHTNTMQARTLEVERKFLVTPSSVSYLRSNGEGSRFEKHKSLGNRIDHDIYFDRNNLFFSRGIYVRQRNGSWEVKIRSGGDYLNSAFTEVEGSDAVKEVIKQHLDFAAGKLGIEEILEPCADFVTKRESWIINDKFKVDVDVTNFGHTVGEVELTRTFLYGNPKNVEEGKEVKLKEVMDKEIKDFMQSCPEAFPLGRPMGKLSAYFSKAQSTLN